MNYRKEDEFRNLTKQNRRILYQRREHGKQREEEKQSLQEYESEPFRRSYINSRLGRNIEAANYDFSDSGILEFDSLPDYKGGV